LSRFCVKTVRTVGVQYFYNGIFQGVVRVAAGNKMAWHCIELDNA
jgi:hypothetical protein